LKRQKEARKNSLLIYLPMFVALPLLEFMKMVNKKNREKPNTQVHLYISINKEQQTE